MDECRFTVPTYNAKLFPSEVGSGELPEFGPPNVPVLVHEAEGIRVVLGSHDRDDQRAPDIQIERQPNGWVIFLRPVGGGDTSGFAYFHHDGRSFLVVDTALGPTLTMQVLESAESIPGFTPPVVPTED